MGLGTLQHGREIPRLRRRGSEGRLYAYLLIDACYLKVRWGERSGDLALLVVVGISASGHREVLAVESAAGERKEAYRNLLRSLLERGLTGVQLVVSDDHEAIKQAVATELPDAAWQRCVVHFERNILAHVPARDTKAVAEDLKLIFKAKRASTANSLADEFIEHYRVRFPKAVATLRQGLAEALSFLAFPPSHHQLIRSTNMLERLFREVKRRTKVVGVFPNETSTVTLCTAVVIRASEDWVLRKYLDMRPLEAMNTQPTQFAT